MIDILKPLSSIQFDHPQAGACSQLLSQFLTGSAGLTCALQYDMQNPSLHPLDGCLKEFYETSLWGKKKRKKATVKLGAENFIFWRYEILEDKNQ